MASSLMSSLFGSSASANVDSAPVAQTPVVDASVAPVQEQPVPNVETTGESVAPAQEQPVQQESKDTKPDVKVTSSFSGYMVDSTGQKKVFKSINEMMSALTGVALPPCDCARCTARRTAQQSAKPAEQTDQKSTEQPAEQPADQTTEQKSTEQPADQPADQPAEQNTRAKATAALVEEFMQTLEAAGMNKCNCSKCVTRRATLTADKTLPAQTETKDTPTNELPASDPADSEKLVNEKPTSNQSLFDALFGDLLKSPGTKYADAYRYTSKNVSYVPLMRRHLRLVAELGERGVTGALQAISKSDARTSAALRDNDVSMFFDTVLIQTLLGVPSKDKTLQARVRLMPDMRSLRNMRRHLPSVYAPALVEVLKSYMESYPDQDVVRFHDDGLGYDVYADLVAAAQEQ